MGDRYREGTGSLPGGASRKRRCGRRISEGFRGGFWGGLCRKQISHLGWAHSNGSEGDGTRCGISLRGDFGRGVRPAARRVVHQEPLLVLRDGPDPGGEGPASDRRGDHRQVRDRDVEGVAVSAEAGGDGERPIPAVPGHVPDLATHGAHAFHTAEKGAIRDAREVPIKFHGYAVSYRGGHAHVRIEQGRYKELKAYFREIAPRRSASALAAELRALPWDATRRCAVNTSGCCGRSTGLGRRRGRGRCRIGGAAASEGGPALRAHLRPRRSSVRFPGGGVGF